MALLSTAWLNAFLPEKFVLSNGPVLNAKIKSERLQDERIIVNGECGMGQKAIFREVE
jgi:hypothetical protein